MVRWGSFTEGTPERAMFDKVSQELKPENFQDWMDVIYATNERLKEPVPKKKSRFGRKKKKAETFEASRRSGSKGYANSCYDGKGKNAASH